MDIQHLISNFQFERILKTDTQTKLLALLGTVEGKHAIFTIEKTAFAETNIDITSLVDRVKLLDNNDIYFWSLGTLAQDVENAPGAKINAIYPATDLHIRKYGTQKQHLIAETPEIYKSKVEPFIQTQKGDRIQWVYNILFKDKESESFVYHDTDADKGFVLLPDMKWDRKTMASLYLITIVNRTDISSIRDLNGSHIEFLESLQQRVKAITSEKFGLVQDELRVFIHYQPSYYHFHIHVVNVSHPGLGDGLNAGKAILLDDVIDNLKLMPDYYQKRTLNYVLGENHQLWDILKNA